ncbi:MAG TPA: glycosyltransferase [Fimbriimonadaceae bacterium]|nr:glycosyltransferase [Fimbriimonadaceae bacterium]
MPRVSILLTCYNHLRFLPAAYESVLAQTFGDCEILAIDDGSQDGTREWLKEREGGKLRCLFNEKNLGTYATLNVGVSEAKGEYIAILNDDDLWAPGKLATQVALLDSNPRFGLVHTSGWFIDDSGTRHPDPEPMEFPFPHLPSGDVFAKLIDHNQIIASSVLVRREAFEKCGLFDPSFYGCGDWNMWLRIAAEYEIAFADVPLTFYRVHGSNAAWNAEKMNEDGRRIREWITGWDAVKKRLTTDPDIRAAYAHNWACLGTEYTWLGRPGEGRRAYLASIKVMPGRIKSYVRWLATFLPKRTFRRLS